MPGIKSIVASSLVAALFWVSSPALAEDETFIIDSGHTHIMFAVQRFGYADTIGIFPDSSGEIVLDRENPANSRVAARVHTPSVWTGLAARDEAARGAHFLDTAGFDTISFQSTNVVLRDETHADVTGDLTLWGISQPVTFDVTLNRIGPDPSLGGREGAGFSMTASISRAAFGNTTAAALIGDEVEIRIEVLAHAPE
jgi:polyisoprenoid-binding protein YceI